ncbi:MAG: hypothetical protein WD509_00920 [Candidatus Paceibacterota bacterium]
MKEVKDFFKKASTIKALSGLAVFSLVWIHAFGDFLGFSKETKNQETNACLVGGGSNMVENAAEEKEGRSFFVSCSGFLK